MALKIGITGGIGSGKTIVCGIFKELGVPIYNADEKAKALMVTDSALVIEILGLFGKMAYQSDGSLNREWIAKIVFSNQDSLHRLNSLVHPIVNVDFEKWHKIHAHHPYVLKEAALIFETGGNKYLDKVIVVYAPEELRKQRVMKRDGTSAETVEARIKQQLPDYDKMLQANFIIYNDGEHSLIPQVFEINQKLLVLSSRK